MGRELDSSTSGLRVEGAPEKVNELLLVRGFWLRLRKCDQILAISS